LSFLGEVNVFSEKDSMVLRGSFSLGSPRCVWITLGLTATTLFVVSLLSRSIVNAGWTFFLAVFSWVVVLGHEKVEFQFVPPGQYVEWHRRRLLRQKLGKIGFSDIKSVELRIFSNDVVPPEGSYNAVSAGFYLNLVDSTVAMIPGGMHVNEARQHFAVLKSHLPTLEFVETESK
jgi:hypothetical protein